jgi:drug/metabolite transporter (DMT)-like permease
VPWRALPVVALPGLLLFVGTAAYGVAVGTGLVSVVSVLATLSPVVTVALAVGLLGERLARRQQVGVAAALLGVVLLAAG